MTTRAQAQQFAQLIATLEPEIRRAFQASVADLQANVDWPRLLEALQRGDIESAVLALNIAPAAWSTYSAAMTAAYAQAGASTIAYIRRSGVGDIGVRFNMANPRAQSWIARSVGESITGFDREAREVARAVIGAGYARGDGPRTIALDLVGRVQGGQRVGGVLGLDAPRAERLAAVAAGMRTPEGVQDLVVNGKVRYKVNKATELRILKAHAAGTAVPAAERETSVRQYQSALLKARGDTVAATEVGSAVMASQQEAWQQTTEEQGLDRSRIAKTWRHARGPGDDARPQHIAMNGATVWGLDTPFTMPDGSTLRFPCDPEGPASQIINCGCSLVMSYRPRVA